LPSPRRQKPEEVHHAKKEGVQFKFMTNPVECIGNKEGWVTGVRCQQMDRLARATHEYLSRS
jgi:NADPH-dependent glutamate synthase beta subunit-like oxidoreductase